MCALPISSAAMRAAGLAERAEEEVPPTEPADEARTVLPPSFRRLASMAALIFWPTDLIMIPFLHSSRTAYIRTGSKIIKSRNANNSHFHDLRQYRRAFLVFAHAEIGRASCRERVCQYV